MPETPVDGLIPAYGARKLFSAISILKAGQVKPFVVSLSNHERLNRSTLRQAQGERVSLDRTPP